MRGATSHVHSSFAGSGISIHTPHAGSDFVLNIIVAVVTYFNPHSPCGERHVYSSGLSPTFLFQSTLPMRGATMNLGIKRCILKISIHTPHAGSDCFCCCACKLIGISIHTPHAGSDMLYLVANLNFHHFNPHSPCGERHPLSGCPKQMF